MARLLASCFFDFEISRKVNMSLRKCQYLMNALRGASAGSKHLTDAPRQTPVRR